MMFNSVIQAKWISFVFRQKMSSWKHWFQLIVILELCLRQWGRGSRAIFQFRNIWLIVTLGTKCFLLNWKSSICCRDTAFWKRRKSPFSMVSIVYFLKNHLNGNNSTSNHPLSFKIGSGLGKISFRVPSEEFWFFDF